MPDQAEQKQQRQSVCIDKKQWLISLKQTNPSYSYAKLCQEFYKEHNRTITPSQVSKWLNAPQLREVSAKAAKKTSHLKTPTYKEVEDTVVAYVQQIDNIGGEMDDQAMLAKAIQIRDAVMALAEEVKAEHVINNADQRMQISAAQAMQYGSMFLHYLTAHTENFTKQEIAAVNKMLQMVQHARAASNKQANITQFLSSAGNAASAGKQRSAAAGASAAAAVPRQQTPIDSFLQRSSAKQGATAAAAVAATRAAPVLINLAEDGAAAAEVVDLDEEVLETDVGEEMHE